MLKRESGQGDENGRNRKRKRSRWADSEGDRAFIPGMPTILPGNMSKDQEELYLLQLQIEEISRRLRSGDLGIPSNPEDRSPSPEPIYNNEGKRLNTREYRVRKKLEEDRHELVERVQKRNPEYKPPADYKPPVVRVSDKVMIPQEEHPDINFVGLLIGPRGNTLKNLEKDTGAKIIIRGKGSVKEGKIGKKDGHPLPGEDEPLHAYITANNPENVKLAAEKIKEIIRQGIEVPEGQNDLRRQQLRELALLNGTLRENDGLAKLKQLQQATTIITNTIVCTVCGGTGHIAQDCKAKRPGDSLRTLQNQNPLDKAKMDSEYSALMAELGQGPPPNQQQQPPPQQNRPPNNPMFPSAPNTQFNQPPPALVPPLSSTNQFNMSAAAPSVVAAANAPPQNKPPSLLNIPTQPPTSSQPPPPPSLIGGPPPVSSIAQNAPPPWQQQAQQPIAAPQPVSTAPPPPLSTAATLGVPPPPGVLSAPPPPPPPGVSQGSLPWQQQAAPQQHHPQQPPAGYAMPPPPPGPPGSAGAPPPWQHTPVSVAPVPPPPPMVSNIAPWQQAPPPPLVSTAQRGFNPVAPPPPPPSGPGGIPLGVPPPPPPN